jgi:hypothetical protein
MVDVRQSGSCEYGEDAGGSVVEVRQGGSPEYGEDASGSEGAWRR